MTSGPTRVTLSDPWKEGETAAQRVARLNKDYDGKPTVVRTTTTSALTDEQVCGQRQWAEGLLPPNWLADASMMCTQWFSTLPECVGPPPLGGVEQNPGPPEKKWQVVGGVKKKSNKSTKPTPSMTMTTKSNSGCFLCGGEGHRAAACPKGTERRCFGCGSTKQEILPKPSQHETQEKRRPTKRRLKRR